MASEHQTKVLVVGSGPAGLIAAWQLARHGVPCMLVERNLDTTRWPKMDITNCRSMELLKRLNLADGLRDVGVDQSYSFDVLFSTGLSEGGELLEKWDLPSPNSWREKISKQNDGSLPREPYQRCSQAVFEAWLKPRLQAEPLIDSHFGLKLDSMEETSTGVTCYLTDVTTSQQHVVHTDFVIGCDGAGSRVRRSMGAELIGGPIPWAMYLIHFKSTDLTRLHKQGQFWHIFFSSGAVIISQDEVETWTVHVPVTLDTDISTLNPEECIYRALGGSAAPFPIRVDEILVTSSWRPNICIADTYRSKGGRVFLSGDACHQNIPTGGYGMNTALGDSFDIGWKLAHVVKGIAGPSLLDSYEQERRPVAVRNIDHSGVHSSVHSTYVEWVRQAKDGAILAQTDEGKELRQKITKQVRDFDGENKDHGIELGYRYNGSPVIVPDTESQEPEWNKRNYIPSTWPGARAPHVFLADGKTSIFDLFGRDYTCVDFTEQGKFAAAFAAKANELQIPLVCLHLPKEHHVASIWGRNAFLIRPDDHVAWRANVDGRLPGDVGQVWEIVVGRQSADVVFGAKKNEATSAILDKGFTATVGHVDQNNVAMLGAFQQ